MSDLRAGKKTAGGYCSYCGFPPFPVDLDSGDAAALMQFYEKRGEEMAGDSVKLRHPDNYLPENRQKYINDL